MASIKFYANILAIAPSGDPTLINHGAGSGIGFYGAGYGISVPVGQYQDTTWVTNSNGTAVDNFQLSNTKFITVSGMSHNNSNVDNKNAPNYYAPLKIEFSHTDPVRVQNCKLRIFNRNDISKQASGVSTMVYENRHPSVNANIAGLAHRGRQGATDAHAWVEYDPVFAMADFVLTSSPGVSGLNGSSVDTASNLGVLTTAGAAHSSLKHDWYLSLSTSPDSIGSKTDFGLYFTCEYL